MQTEVTQLRAEERQKEVDDLKTTLDKKRAEAEEKSKEVKELAATLDGKKKEMDEKDRELEETKRELDDLNKLLEEKSKEADECMDKYCSLMIKVHKLEETNDALKTRLEQISANQRENEASGLTGITDNRRRSGRKSSKHPEVKMDGNAENLAPSTQRSPQGPFSGKRGHRDISDKDIEAQEALHNLTKKIKANAMTTPKPRTEQEDEEFRPEGLPELVQKG